MTIHVPDDRLEANWRAIAAELDAPRPARVERALTFVRVPEPVARLVAGTPALRRAWIIATVVAILFGAGAADPARPRESLLGFLAIAPLVPVIGVALAYGPGSDPAYEATLATPRSGLTLVLTRAVTVLGVATGLLLAGTLVLPERALLAFAWLVPAVVLSALCLAATTFVAPRYAALAVCGGWIVVVSAFRRNADDPLVLFGPVAHVVLAALGVAAVCVLIARRVRFERLAVMA